MKAGYSQSLPKAWRGVAQVFTALGDEHRQRMLLLFERGERLTAGQIAAASTLSQPTVSHHLKVLRDAGVLKSEKRGRQVYYWIDGPTLRQALARVLEYVDAQV
jgi:DNA-binding transcriptional ArsR family regulator